MGKKLLGVIGVVFLVALSAMFAVLATAANARSSTTTLTLWHNYGTEGNAVATNNLVRAFEKSHPDIKIKVVSQPAENYFALLQAASISKTGPDLATMWTGLFALKYQKFLADLKPYFSAAERAKLNGIRYMAPDFNPAKGFLVMPLEVQFYIGFYNKALFKKAGLSGPPESWAELQTACQKLNAKGITPILVGADSQAISATFLPWYDFSYLMAGILSPDQWRGLYTGKVAWNSPLVTAAATKWAALRTLGVHEQGRADETRRPRPVREGQGCHDLRRELGHGHAPEGRSGRSSALSPRRTRTRRSAASSSTRAMASRS